MGKRKKRGKDRKGETKEKETKRRSSKTTTPKKKAERTKTPLRAQGELTPAEAGTSVKRSKVPLFPQTPASGGEGGAAPKSPSPISTTHRPHLQLSHQQHQRRTDLRPEWSMVAGVSWLTGMGGVGVS